MKLELCCKKINVQEFREAGPVWQLGNSKIIVVVQSGNGEILGKDGPEGYWREEIERKLGVDVINIREINVGGKK